MRKIVECVPNFSEGRDKEVINAIARAIDTTEGCKLLDVDPGAATHRTVYTFVGDPTAVIDGALAGARVARDCIDMRQHKGEHPRFGALDVCPFIPVAGLTIDACADIAREFGQRLAYEMGVPIFLYGAAAKQEQRRKLPDIRRGEYEGLAAKLEDPAWVPDFGPTQFVPMWGATAVGARSFLIAYNVNILGTANQAHRIALNLRETGRGKGRPGRLKAVKGMGWYVDDYNVAQVTVNLTDYGITAMHQFFEAVKEEAAALEVGVVGSEVVGLVPLEAMLMAADYYMDKENLLMWDQDQKIRLVIDRLGLNAVAKFDPQEKIIEYRVADPRQDPLARMSMRRFIEAVGERSSAPGGGAVSAAIAALGIGLGAMTAKLTYGVRKFEDLDGIMRNAIPPLHNLCQELVPIIDADSNAFSEYMQGLQMPNVTDAQKDARTAKIEQGLKTAIEVPLKAMRLGDAAWKAMRLTAQHGNAVCKSDIQVGVRALETGIWGAYQNVCINMEGIKDHDFKAKTIEEAEAIVKRARQNCSKILKIIDQR
jgi:glutamate formiminotransferase/formiminotetrahydrofolate cyclodeaminase